SITIGETCLVSGFVYLQTSMHRFTDREVAIRDQGYTHGPIVIGKAAWLAAHVVVLPGITIGPDAIIGSNAVVTQNVTQGKIVAGVPAKPIGDRDKTLEFATD